MALGMNLGEWHRALTEAQSVGFNCGSRVLTAGPTLKQIALRMHVDASRISQVHSAALGRLKASVDSVLSPGHAQASESHTLSMAAGI
jgi:hypothetical protein